MSVATARSALLGRVLAFKGTQDGLHAVQEIHHALAALPELGSLRGMETGAGAGLEYHLTKLRANEGDY